MNVLFVLHPYLITTYLFKIYFICLSVSFRVHLYQFSVNLIMVLQRFSVDLIIIWTELNWMVLQRFYFVRLRVRSFACSNIKNLFPCHIPARQLDNILIFPFTSNLPTRPFFQNNGPYFFQRLTLWAYIYSSTCFI